MVSSTVFLSGGFILEKKKRHTGCELQKFRGVSYIILFFTLDGTNPNPNPDPQEIYRDDCPQMTLPA